eukprot:TRINITY_DN59906_c0_g2_i1.p3 TRINITY_DN59906_c0_g2~~TRINITY_DN59906_c0_g2_i1.p3  ORF type:complete len:104 (+),score=13.17 TRINITY_DN59906_c0_g2_i1:582-893(+)
MEPLIQQVAKALRGNKMASETPKLTRAYEKRNRRPPRRQLDSSDTKVDTVERLPAKPVPKASATATTMSSEARPAQVAETPAAVAPSTLARRVKTGRRVSGKV